MRTFFFGVATLEGFFKAESSGVVDFVDVVDVGDVDDVDDVDDVPCFAFAIKFEKDGSGAVDEADAGEWSGDVSGKCFNLSQSLFVGLIIGGEADGFSKVSLLFLLLFSSSLSLTPDPSLLIDTAEADSSKGDEKKFCILDCTVRELVSLLLIRCVRDSACCFVDCFIVTR
jgi:hypothetical protein